MNSGGRLAASALVYTLANALSAGIPFLLLPLLTRLLTPEEYGIVAMFSVTVTVLGAFTGLSVHGAVGVRYFQQDKYNLRRYVGTSLLLLLASTVVVLLIVSALLPMLETVTHVPGKWLTVAVIVSACQFIVQVQLALWQAAHRPVFYGLFRIGQTAVDAAISLLLILGIGMTWEGRLGGITAGCIAFMLIALITLRSGKWVTWRWDKRYVLDALHFGVPLIPHVIGGMVIVMVDRVMITNLLDVASTGIYMVAMQIGMVLGLLTDSFNRAFAPWLMGSLKHQDATRDRRIVRYTYIYFLGVLALGLAMGFSAPAFMSWLVGPQYQVAAGFVVYITVGFAFGGMYYMVTNYIFYAGKTPWLAGVTFGSGLFHVAATYYLLSTNGLVGAAQAFMLSQAVMFVSAWWVAHKSRPMPWALQRFA